VGDKVCEYVTPTVPLGSELVPILKGMLIVIDRDFVTAAPVLSVTRKITEVGPPAIVGVPEMVPLELSDKPAGNVPEDNDQA
jgi:hypothetical protein